MSTFGLLGDGTMSKLRSPVIATCCRLKVMVVEEDEED